MPPIQKVLLVGDADDLRTIRQVVLEATPQVAVSA